MCKYIYPSRCASPHQNLVRGAIYQISNFGRGTAGLEKINTDMVRGATTRRS